MKLNRITLPAVVVVTVALVLALWGFTAFAGDADPGGSGDPLVTQSYVDQYVQWKVADLKAGQVLKGKAGTELLVRRGQAVVVDSSGNGIPDVTAGVDIAANDKVALNHLLIIPREDGRGIKAIDFAVVMYRGGASIQ
ncbi:hypothetical protein Psch_04006 [Pelotomaculum schinkii]|uniref:Uncharacterized protein n=1 Tax=Pelotomaculum schinkii TaxID=78350 RepID=A0A4Y7R6M2_9FIRM|nr:hypothetical protein [Pelotomaculum schinkii]TEB04281.1 hypothetical protein Psch_04006 [Pelotomaculum schinkii]